MENLFSTIPKPLAIILVIALLIVIYFIYTKSIATSRFTGKLVTPMATLNLNQPKSFPDLEEKQTEIFNLAKPDVPEEIGLGTKYPQGDGVGMSRLDSNSFYPGNPGPLLTDFSNPESYGESSLTDPTGTKGSNQGARVLRIVDTGNQMNYKPVDESTKCVFSAAYKDLEVEKGLSFINGTNPIDYSDSFNPEENLAIQTSPGQTGDLPICEKTYPNVVKYGEFCITEGDIPYGQVVNGKVNPRLVSRWESYTGDYSREDALNPVDGVLYPKLNVLTSS